MGCQPSRTTAAADSESTKFQVTEASVLTEAPVLLAEPRVSERALRAAEARGDGDKLPAEPMVKAPPLLVPADRAPIGSPRPTADRAEAEEAESGGPEPNAGVSGGEPPEEAAESDPFLVGEVQPYVSESFGGAFDGSWSSLEGTRPRATIAGHELTWPSGKRIAFTATSPATCSILEEGATHTGELSAGQLRWSDGDTWIRRIDAVSYTHANGKVVEFRLEGSALAKYVDGKFVKDVKRLNLERDTDGEMYLVDQHRWHSSVSQASLDLESLASLVAHARVPSSGLHQTAVETTAV